MLNVFSGHGRNLILSQLPKSIAVVYAIFFHNLGAGIAFFLSAFQVTIKAALLVECTRAEMATIIAT